jgi:hypothetical protein
LEAAPIRTIIDRVRRTGKLTLQGDCTEDQFAMFTENAGIDNVERFSLGGAAREPSGGGTQGGVRAGERKTDWTKPLPPPSGLWALNAAGPFAGAPLGHSGRRLGAIGRANQAFG